MTGLLTNLGTVIKLEPQGGNQTTLTGEITNWDLSGFNQTYTLNSSFGMDVLSRNTIAPGKVSFNFKFKNYDIDDVNLFGIDKTNNTGSIVLTEDKLTPLKITITWSDGSDTMIKAFYNAYGMSVKSSGKAEDLPTASVEFFIPPFNEVGSSNYYQSLALANESAWDTYMGW